MSKRPLVVLLLFFCFGVVKVEAQNGSNASFEFLNLNASARNTALGGFQPSMSLDSGQMRDASLWMLNPAYSHEALSGHVSLGYMPYYANLHYSTVSYLHHFKKSGVWGAGIQYLRYGSFQSFDVAGLPQGEFSAQDYALLVNHSHQIGVYRMGANLKMAASQIGGYQAVALLADLGGAFVHPEQDFTVTLLFSNLGVLLNDYSPQSRSRLPTDVRVGLSFKPEHMPFRFHLGGYKFLRDTRTYFQGEGEERASLLGKLFRHLTFGGEMLLSPHFNIRIGYNHLIKSSLQLQQVSGGAGLTFGFMLRIRSLQLDFSREFYHVAGGFSHLSVSADLNQLIFRK